MQKIYQICTEKKILPQLKESEARAASAPIKADRGKDSFFAFLACAQAQLI
jgi:hypothetical protein